MENLKKSPNDSTTAKYHGWSNGGIKRFNELFDLVSKERETEEGPAFDAYYYKHCCNLHENSNTKKRKIQYEYEPCRHELWIDDPMSPKISEDEITPGSHDSDDEDSNVNEGTPFFEDDNSLDGFCKWKTRGAI